MTRVRDDARQKYGFPMRDTLLLLVPCLRSTCRRFKYQRTLGSCPSMSLFLFLTVIIMWSKRYSNIITEGYLSGMVKLFPSGQLQHSGPPEFEEFFSRCGLPFEHNQNCLRIVEGVRSYTSGLGHQLTELTFFLELGRQHGAVPKVLPFTNKISVHNHSIDFLNKLLGLESHLFKNMYIRTGHLKRVPFGYENDTGCNIVFTGSYKQCPGFGKYQNCFRSPAVSLSFTKFLPCLRALALREGTWDKQRPVRFEKLSTTELFVVWHVRLGDIEPHGPHGTYYQKIYKGLQPIFTMAIMVKHIVIANWDQSPHGKSLEHRRQLRDMLSGEVEFLSLGVEQAFLHFMHADFLIGGGSSFPRVAALFSHKPIYVNTPPFHGWNYMAEYIPGGIDILPDGTVLNSQFSIQSMIQGRNISHKFKNMPPHK